MKQKTPYKNPQIDFISIMTADIIRTSGGNDIDEDYGENDGEWL